MKVLFLDIDGVLNNGNLAEKVGGYPMGLSPDQLQMFDHTAISMIRNVCKRTGSVIVLSSSWRFLHDFHEVGESLNLPIVSATPRGRTRQVALDVDLAELRGHEIAAWIRENGPIEKYAIIDDDSDMLPAQLPYFVKTSHETGMHEHHADKLLELLGD